MDDKKQLVKIQNENDLKVFLANNYMNQIKNFFGHEKEAMKFLSCVMSAVQRTPKLLQCEPKSLINSFLTMAQLQLMPSDVSGEAYVLPYDNKNGPVAQFQLGYQGLVTLFFRAGGTGIRSDIVREHDEFSYINGVMRHSINILKSNEERGQPIAAYAIATVNGQEVSKVMNAKDIVDFGRRFSKSFGSTFTPWKIENDPELWMWKKTVLKQLGKMLPKNETISRAIAEDNRDSIISDRIEAAKKESDALKMGAVLQNPVATAMTAPPVVAQTPDPQKETPQNFADEVNGL